MVDVLSSDEGKMEDDASMSSVISSRTGPRSSSARLPGDSKPRPPASTSMPSSSSHEARDGTDALNGGTFTPVKKPPPPKITTQVSSADSDIEVGDRIKVRHSNEWLPAKVLRVASTGSLLHVRMEALNSPEARRWVARNNVEKLPVSPLKPKGKPLKKSGDRHSSTPSTVKVTGRAADSSRPPPTRPLPADPPQSKRTVTPQHATDVVPGGSKVRCE